MLSDLVLICIVYGSSNHNLRKLLWRDFNHRMPGEGVPWIATGEFNSVTGVDGTSNPANFDQRRSSRFNSLIFEHCLFDMGVYRTEAYMD